MFTFGKLRNFDKNEKSYAAVVAIASVGTVSFTHWVKPVG